MPLEDHPLRYWLANELHARPFPNISAPAQAIYVAIKQPKDAAKRDRGLYRAHLLALLEDSVRLQLRSDVPVGLLLSGGLDSGLLVALAARHTPHALKTFTARFTDGVDESPLAAEVAARYGTDHQVIDVDADDAAEHLW